MLRTKSGLPKHCSWNLDRHGKRRVRFRKGCFTTYLAGIPWSEDFMRQYAAALEGLKAQLGNIGAERTKPGSFNALCVSYYRSPEFRGLKPSTQAVRRNIIERFRNEHGDKPLARLGSVHIREIIGTKAGTPEAANNLLKVLRVLLSYAVSLEMIRNNPAMGVKRYRSQGEGFPTWTEAEDCTVSGEASARHTTGTCDGAAALYRTAAGRCCAHGLAACQGGYHRRAAAETLPAAPRNNLTFLVTEFGKPFSAAGFGNWFRDQCNLARLPQCSAHGLRKAAATRLADAGCSGHEGMGIT